jgi:signal transduction histidine kinase
MKLDIQVLPLLVRDGELICSELERAGLACRVSESAAGIARDIECGADIILLLEEALDESSIRLLADSLHRQPSWSDVPVIVLTAGGAVSSASQRLATMREPLGNVTLIERPVRAITLISSVRAAVRARERQYEVRGHLSELKAAEDALRRSHESLERQVADRTATLRQLSASLMRSQDEERRRIARELHDSIGQYLAGLSMELHRLASAGNLQLAPALKMVETCISETRTISHLLHPPLLDEVGLASAMSWYVDGFVARSGIQVSLELEEIPRMLADIETAIFRVLQEALTNIHRHSGSKTAKVSLAIQSSSVVLQVLDYGSGMPKASLDRFASSGTAGGVGLAGMRERIREFAGDLKITSDENGTQLAASIPFVARGEA